MIERPTADEYNPYYGTYVDLVPDGDVLDSLERQLEVTVQLLSGLPSSWESVGYEPGKWTIREVLGHVIDTERLFSFRALHMARGDQAPLPGMDQDDWVARSNAAARPVAELLVELRALRKATIALFRSLDSDALVARGTASGFEFSVRAFVWIIAGHELHHRRLIEERYLPVLVAS